LQVADWLVKALLLAKLYLYVGSSLCVFVCVACLGFCISPPYVDLFCSSSEHLAIQSGDSVLPNYFHGDAIFSRCAAVIYAWVMYRRRFHQATGCLSKSGISAETCLPSRCSAAGGFQTVIC
jgi:hypothetical protein